MDRSSELALVSFNMPTKYALHFLLMNERIVCVGASSQGVGDNKGCQGFSRFFDRPSCVVVVELTHLCLSVCIEPLHTCVSRLNAGCWMLVMLLCLLISGPR